MSNGIKAASDGHGEQVLCLAHGCLSFSGHPLQRYFIFYLLFFVMR